MRRLLILFVLVSAAQAWLPATPPVFLTFVQGTPPAAGCNGLVPSNYTAANGFCSMASVGLKHVTEIMGRVSASTIDTGDAQGGVMDLSGWTAADAVFNDFALYTGNGNVVLICANTGNVTTCTVGGGLPVPPDGAVCISGNSVSAYNACWTVTGTTYTGAGCATQVNPCTIQSYTFAQTSPVATGTGGNDVFACSGSGTPQLCKIAIIVQHHRGGSTKNMPDYPFSQAYAETVAYTRSNNTRYDFHQSVKIGTHYYYVTNTIDSSGGGVSGGVDPGNWSTSGGTSLDGTITWKDNGIHALMQESVVGPGYAGGGNAPKSFTGGGAIYSLSSTTGAGAGQCTPAACTSDDVGLGFPMFWENPYSTWLNNFNTTQHDAFGNPGSIAHYAGVPWVAQLDYLRFGSMDNGEWNYFLANVLFNAGPANTTGVAWVTGGMSYTQFRNAVIDNYGANMLSALWNAKVTNSAPFQLDTGTNCFATGNSLGQCQDYSRDIVQQAKNASPAYGFGNQGWWATDVTTVLNNNCGSQVTGCEFGTFDLWRVVDFGQSPVPVRHIQLQAPTCPIHGNPAHCTNPLEGSLAQFMQLGPEHNFNRMEWFETELSCTYDSRYTYANGVASGCEYADMQADNYQAYINALALGLPAATSGMNGNSGMKGTAGIQ